MPFDLPQNGKPWRAVLFKKQKGNRIAARKRSLNMARYIARFMKDVLGENGHEAEICQCSIEIEAQSRAHATELAKKRFCETERVKDWSLHADRVRIADAEFPS
jgi:hypothetical protein